MQNNIGVNLYCKMPKLLAVLYRIIKIQSKLLNYALLLKNFLNWVTLEKYGIQYG